MVRPDDTHLVHALEALLTDLVPADLVLAAVLRDVLRPGMKGVVGGRVGKVENEGLFLVLVLVETIDGVSGEGVGVIELLVRTGVAHDHLVLDGPAADAGLAFSARRSLAGAGLEPWVEEIAAAVGQPVVAVEATGRGQSFWCHLPAIRVR